MSDLNPDLLLRSLEAGVSNGDFTSSEARDALCECAGFLTAQELGETQAAIQGQFTLLTSLHDAVIVERIKRNDSNQAELFSAEG